MAVEADAGTDSDCTEAGEGDGFTGTSSKGVLEES